MTGAAGVRVVLATAVLLAGCAGIQNVTSGGEAELPEMQAVLALTEGPLEDWGCGHQFTVGTGDQTVRLTVQEVGAAVGTPPEPGVVAVDGTAWEGRLVTGRDLFAQWCDDVVERGEPDVVETTSHPVTGTLSWSLDATDASGACDGPASARLTDAVVVVEDRTYPLPDLDLANEFFGCFAG